MIPSSAALPVVYGERPQERLSEPRQVGGQEQRSERRLEGRPEYSEASRARLRRHPAPITGTRSMDLLPTVIRHTDIQAMDTELTLSLAMDIRGTPVLPHMLVRLAIAMRTRADLGSRITPL